MIRCSGEMLHKALQLLIRLLLDRQQLACTAWGSPVSARSPVQRAVFSCLAQAAFPGLGAIALDALTRREWVKEDELALQLKVHPKVLRRVLRYLEQVPSACQQECWSPMHLLLPRLLQLAAWLTTTKS